MLIGAATARVQTLPSANFWESNMGPDQYRVAKY